MVENVNISCEQLGGALDKEGTTITTPPTDPTGNWEEK